MGKDVFVIFLLILATSLFGKSAEQIAKDLKLNPSSKAGKQWERIFKNPTKMTEYGIDKISEGDKKMLCEYLKNHAADSDRPTVPGNY